MSSLVVIPARKGSKGVPGKNKKLLNGKPLIQYTIEAALKVFSKDDICISTDDEEIIQLSVKLGLSIPFVRPAYLSSDNATSQEVILHALNNFSKKNYTSIVLLQPTSPFRTSKHIKEALSIFRSTVDAEMIVSVYKPKANPYFNLFEEDKNHYLQKSKPSKATRRQDIPVVYEFNGAIYCIDKEALLSKDISEFKRIKKYEMDEKSSHDIDTLYDWKIAEVLMKDKGNLND